MKNTDQRCVFNQIAAACHALAMRGQIDSNELSADSLIVCEGKKGIHGKSNTLEVCQRMGLEPPHIIFATSYSSMLGLIAAGRGYGLHPSSPEDRYDDTLRTLRLSGAENFVSTSLIWLRSSVSESRDSFLQEIADHYTSF